LRARRSDIPQLVAHALRCVPARAVSEAAMEKLVAHQWPGNVRELMHVVERAGALASGEIIDVTDLPDAVQNPPPASAPPGTERLTLREAVARLERQMITRALEETDGNRSEAARRLGIARAQLYAKLQEFGIE
jgi:DNA-binding NtrC family response regulator